MGCGWPALAPVVSESWKKYSFTYLDFAGDPGTEGSLDVTPGMGPMTYLRERLLIPTIPFAGPGLTTLTAYLTRDVPGIGFDPAAALTDAFDLITPPPGKTLGVDWFQSTSGADIFLLGGDSLQLECFGNAFLDGMTAGAFDLWLLFDKVA